MENSQREYRVFWYHPLVLLHTWLIYFFKITQYNSNTQNARTLILMNPGNEDPILMSIFENWTIKSSKLRKSSTAPYYRHMKRLPNQRQKVKSCICEFKKLGRGFQFPCTRCLSQCEHMDVLEMPARYTGIRAIYGGGVDRGNHYPTLFLLFY